MEVPIVASDAVQYVTVKVPALARPADELHPCTPVSQDIAGSISVGGHCDFLLWRIHKDFPTILEITEWSLKHEPPKYGLHLVFEEPLSPFACILRQQQRNRRQDIYALFLITTYGLAYRINLKVPTSYNSGSSLASSDVTQIDISKYLPRIETITAVAAATDILCVGGQNGWVLCFHIDQLHQNPEDFYFELRELDARLGRLWGLVRGKRAGVVRDLAIVDHNGKMLLFSLHEDSNLRIWDLNERQMISSYSFASVDLSVLGAKKLYLGDVDASEAQISVAVLFRSLSGKGPMADTLVLCKLKILSNEGGSRVGPCLQERFSLDHGNVIDIKLCWDRIWILKHDEASHCQLLHASLDTGVIYKYQLQEQYVAEQLFQGSNDDIDDILLVQHFLNSVAQCPGSLSALFLRRLLQPGIRQRIPLREVMDSYKRRLSDHAFRSLENLSKEMVTIIETEATSSSQAAIAYEWKTFCTRYMQSWLHNNMPYGLFFDPSIAGIGLIRRHAVSIVRDLDGIEELVHGMATSTGESFSLPASLEDDDKYEIIKGILECSSSISRHLGRTSLSLFYESLIKPSNLSFQSVISCFVKILDAGYDFSGLKQSDSHLGLDAAVAKEQKQHKLQRIFSLNTLLSLQALYEKARSWDTVLDAIEIYLTKLIPEKYPLDSQSAPTGTQYNMHTTLVVLGISQYAESRFNAARDLLLLLGFLLKLKGQVYIEPSHVLRIQMYIIPKTEDILVKWFLLHWMCTTSAEAPLVQDFSSQLSSLHIDGKVQSKSWEGKLGTGDLTLAGILLFGFPSGLGAATTSSAGSLLRNDERFWSVEKFSSWIFWGESDQELPSLSSRAIALSAILLQYGQNSVLENLFITVDEQLNESRYSIGTGGTDGEAGACLHLLGLCFLARAHLVPHEKQKYKLVQEAIRCFFRACSGEAAGKALQALTLQNSVSSDIRSRDGWKLYYFEIVMQIFDQHSLGAGARQFAYAAIEQVDEAFDVLNCEPDDPLISQATQIKARLWANVFKFSMDLEQYREAYCAIVSNPDEESKHICLRRLIIQLYERKATEVLCDCELPFVGLLEKVDQELFWKAECSDITAKPNPYKILYAFHMYHQNWRKAAGYMYRYTIRLKEEFNVNVQSRLSFTLQERLEGLVAAINALHLVDPRYAWLDAQLKSSSNKRVRRLGHNNFSKQEEISKPLDAVDVLHLENEYLLTLAQQHLVTRNVKLPSFGGSILPSDLVVLLVRSGLYEMVFTILTRFWKGSSFERELEYVFKVIAEQCCTENTSSIINESSRNLFLLKSAKDYRGDTDMLNIGEFHTENVNSKTAWHKLQFYLEKYINMHSRLPVVVVETLLYTDPLIQLPVWLVDMLKGSRRASWGMAGQKSNPAALLRLYIEYGRFKDATYLLIEFIDAWADLRPSDIIRRKTMTAAWFPYNLVERLYFLLKERNHSSAESDQYEKLQKMLDDLLSRHLIQMKIDSDDTLLA